MMKKLLVSSMLSVMFFGCASSPSKNDARQMEMAKNVDISRADVDKLYIVDCLLPGQVRSLGASANYITARRPIRTSALDCEVRGGEYVAFDRADYATALKVWQAQATGGDPEAQTMVGEIYQKGMGVPPDYEMAALWFKKAAEQNYSRAQINLGYLYEKGLGVQQDLSKAMNYYRLASGLPDDIEYVSSVELSSQRQELSSLREEVKKLEEEAEKYKQQLRNSQMKLKSATDEETRTKREMEKLQGELSSLNSALEESKTSSGQSVIIRESIATGKASSDGGKTVAMPPQEVQALISNLFAQIKQKESDLQQQGLIIARLAKETRSTQAQIAAIEKQQLALAGPTIEILDPPLALTRGKPSVLLRSPVKTKDVYGKVDAPAGVKGFYYNKKEIFLNKDNSFSIPVPINSQTVPVLLEVTDANNNSAVLDFIISSPIVSANVTPVQSVLDTSVQDFGKGQYHALVIGNNDYKHLPRLKTAINDARETAEILKDKYGFEVTLLIDADRYAILSALYKLGNSLRKGDNLLVYYAGHGDLDKVNDRGYWLPIDAEANNSANWISNVAITDILNTLPSNHVMVVADSCYSGTMSKTAVPRMDTSIPPQVQKKWLELMSKSRSRTVLSSGGVQPVLDEGGGNHSIFAKAFLSALKENKGILQGYTLYRQVSQEVSIGSANIQTPEYAPIRYAGHETGQFFFIPRT